jgi:hypothetical protein
MTRLILTWVAWISLVPTLSASLTPRKEPPPFCKQVPRIPVANHLVEAREQATGLETESEFIVTNRTEVLLNGKPCRYEEVPEHAGIVRMEVAADKRTVLKIHFRTWK